MEISSRAFPVTEKRLTTLANESLIRFIRQKPSALQTVTFYFERPREFEFTAGQFIEITLPLSDVDESDRVHTFSLSSAPYEDSLAITTRLRDSPFKRALSLLKPDDLVQIEGPYGKFGVQQDTPRPIAFLIGGVGITPAYSIIKQAARDSQLAGFYLFYSNRRRPEAPFLAELARLERENPGFHLVATMTADESWTGEKARVDMNMIRKHIDPATTSFYTSGPPGMVTAMREMLSSNGVRKEQVLFETFSGY
jgi:ferredoxin-NADP reductase